MVFRSAEPTAEARYVPSKGCPVGYPPLLDACVSPVPLSVMGRKSAPGCTLIVCPTRTLPVVRLSALVSVTVATASLAQLITGGRGGAGQLDAEDGRRAGCQRPVVAE